MIVYEPQIEFDVNAGKKQAFTGPYADMAALGVHWSWDKTRQAEWTCRDAYKDFAGETSYGVIAPDSFVTTPNNRVITGQRMAAVARQSQNYVHKNIGGAATERDDIVPVYLHPIFAKAAESSEKFTVLSLSSIQTSPFFALAHQYPDLDLEVTNLAHDLNHADNCSTLISVDANLRPDITNKIVYTDSVEGRNFDLVHFNGALPYYVDKKDLDQIFENIAATKARDVVFNNLVKGDNTKTCLMAQVYNGGVIPLMFFDAEDIKARMEKIGYRLEREYSGNFNARIDGDSAIAKQAVQFNNFHFVLA